MLHALILLPALALLGRAEAACPSSATVLRDAVNAANAAFAAMDQAGFEQARDEARVDVACLAEPITPVDAAALHRLEAFNAFLVQDGDRALLAFRASLALQPSFTLPDTVAPTGSPLDRQYDAARALPDARFTALSGPMGSLLLVDGALSWARPESRPAVLQVMSMDGRVTWSGYLWPESPLPPDLVPSTSKEASENLVKRTFVSPHPRVTRSLAMGALAGAAVSAGVLAGAWATHSAYVESMGVCLSGGCDANPDASEQDLERLRIRTNGLAVTAGGLGVVAGGLGVAALVSLRW